MTQRNMFHTFSMIIMTSVSVCFANRNSPEATVHSRAGSSVVLPCVARQRSSGGSAHVIEWFRSSEPTPFFIKVGRLSAHVDTNFQSWIELYKSKARPTELTGRVSLIKTTPSSTFLSASLSVRNLTLDDAGSYRCLQSVLGSKQGFERHENLVELIVTTPPTFTRPLPARYSARVGQPLLLRCHARGVPVPTITWTKGGRRLSSSGITVSDGTLRIASLQRSDAGKYTCRAGSVEGSVEQSTHVFVTAPPQFVESPQDATEREGENVLFKCKADGYPTNITYSWFHNGVLVTGNSPRKKIPQSGTLVIWNLKSVDRGQITCQASNGYGRAPSVTASLTVLYAARVVRMPRRVFGGISMPLTLHCPAVADPPVTRVIWKKNGRNIRIQQDPRLSTDGNGSLIIHNIRSSDSGPYTCTPYNLIGTHGESPVVRMVIRDPPRFVVSPKKKYRAAVGETLVAPCAGIGDPLPTVTWRKLHGKTTDYSYCIEGGNLSIVSTRKEHHGIWQCVLSNAVGDVTRDVMVVVTHTTPHVVQNLTAEVVDDSSFRVTWEPNFDGGFPQHFMIWYKEVNQGDNMWRSEYRGGDQKVALLPQLKPNTFYQVSVMPENKLGKGAFSPTVTVKTNARVIPQSTPSPTLPSPSGLMSTTDERGQVALEWQPLRNAHTLLGYVIEYRRIGGDDTKEDVTSLKPVPAWAQKETNNGSQAATSRTRRSVVDSRWERLDTTPFNVTSYVIKPEQMYRDQIYEFHVLAATRLEYTLPSEPLRLSTKGLAAYPCFVEKYTVLRHPVVIGVITGSFAMLAIVALIVLWRCRHKLANLKRRNSNKERNTQNVNSFISDDEKRCCNERDPVDPDDHIIINDGFSSLSCLARQQVTVTSKDSDVIAFEKNTEFSEGEDYNVLPSHPSSDKYMEAAGVGFKRRSVDEESVRRRRETAARVLQAQQARRSRIISSSRDGAFQSTPCSVETSRPLRLFPVTSSQLTSAPVRFLTLDDRRDMMSPTCDQNDSCFGVISSFSPEFSAMDDDVIASCHATSHVAELTSQQVPLLASSPNVNDDTVVTSHTLMHDANLRRPRSRASYSFEHFRGRQRAGNTGSTFNRSFGGVKGVFDAPSFEIDCSNSDIEVRYIRSTAPRPDAGETTNRDSICKIGSNLVDKSSGRRSTPRVAEIETRMRNKKRNWNEAERQKRISLEALLSPTHQQPPQRFSREFPSNDTLPKTAIGFATEIPERPKERNENISALNTTYDVTSNDGNDVSYGAVPKPTVISISDIAWNTVRESDTMRSFATPTSSLSPNHSPEKLTKTISPSKQPASSEPWGSLGRPARLKNLSLPVTSVASSRDKAGEQRSLSFSQSNRSDHPTNMFFLPSRQGRRSLPSSPTKALRSLDDVTRQRRSRVLSCSDNESRDPRKNANQPKNLSPKEKQNRHSFFASSSSPRLTSPSFRRHRSHGESLSSGYVTQDTTGQLSPGGAKGHADRRARDNSSIEDNYEWDSEFAMESEILEALRNFESTKSTSSMSAELRDELLKFAGDANSRRTASASRLSPRSPTMAGKSMSPTRQRPESSMEETEHTKQDIERRCAALRQEFLHFRLLQEQADFVQQKPSDVEPK
uniref:Uncharacterized protein LOC100184924 n=1 Tax=Phallusia mammillata TaxID=59560 RepID=A0A6F9DIP6_9ASCI|nr:uncharacterized protein LOC100184924 [Phallusia mammillata]